MSNVLNISHQQSSKENMKTSVKTQETHLKKREMEVCRKFLQDESLMKMKVRRKRRIEKGGEKFRSLSLLLSSYWLI